MGGEGDHDLRGRIRGRRHFSGEVVTWSPFSFNHMAPNVARILARDLPRATHANVPQ
jgi:hypothetical protein